MATFISLITFTDKGIQHVDETTERAEAFSDFTKRVGDHFKSVVYWAVERHDVVVKDIYWTHGVLPENTDCLIFLTFFRDAINLVSSVIVRIQNHESHCLRTVTACVYRDPFASNKGPDTFILL
jgi:hypothetical protein